MDNSKTQFLYNSINDIQSTIRAIDTKVNMLLVILIIPLAKLGSIYNVCIFLTSNSSQWLFNLFSVLLVVIFGISWVISFLAAMRSIISIDNPAMHISGDNKPMSAFYSVGNFEPKFEHVFRNLNVMSKKTFEEHYSAIPTELEEINKELAFEQMKLEYIRTMKMLRFRWAYMSLICFVAFGGIIWNVYLLVQ